MKTYNKKEILDTYNLSEDKFTVLFFGGGEFGLGKTKTAEIFESFVQESLKEKIQIIAIAGKNPKMKESFENLSVKLDVYNNAFKEKQFCSTSITYLYANNYKLPDSCDANAALDKTKYTFDKNYRFVKSENI